MDDPYRGIKLPNQAAYDEIQKILTALPDREEIAHERCQRQIWKTRSEGQRRRRLKPRR